MMKRRISLPIILTVLSVCAFLGYAKASRQCSQSLFECSNKKCISREHMCDGVDGCGDNSDEQVCARFLCHSSIFQCLDGKCISRGRFCDVGNHCDDNSDERYCHIDTNEVCKPGWFRCLNMSRCIPSYWVCNGYRDCAVVTEETNCGLIPCTSSTFQCFNRNCIRREMFCNNRDDCGDNSDERYCNKTNIEVCPIGWFQCPNMNRCIPSYWKCDGHIDCIVESEEKDCGNNSVKVSTKTATKIPDNSAIKKSDKTHKETPNHNANAYITLKSWFLRRRKSGSRTDRWGSQVHRIAVALHLADNSTFCPGNSTGEEIRNELMMQLLHRLAKEKIMSSEELALYIHALVVACMNPMDFYGEDLVRDLRRRVEDSGNHTNPFLILALCNAGNSMTARDVERVTRSYDSQHRPFWTDYQALASMALACISSRSFGSVDERILMEMLRELKSHQFRNGTVDNFKTTALVVQALFIYDSYKKDFDIDSATKILIDGLNGIKSLLKAYYALPVLYRKSLLNVTSNHCIKQPVAEEEALQKALDVNGETMTVLYSVWMGDEINVGRTWRLRMRVNNTIYNAIETIAKIDDRQKVEYNVVNGKPYVAALNGKEDDPEMGMLWFIYLRTLSSDEDPKIVEESPVDIKLKPNQEIILWYKHAPWNRQSLTEKPVTFS